MKDLILIGGILFFLYELQPRAAAAPTLNILNAGPNVPIQSLTWAQLETYVSEDVILPDEELALWSTINGYTSDGNALTNGIAKINAWLQAGGAAA